MHNGIKLHIAALITSVAVPTLGHCSCYEQGTISLQPLFIGLGNFPFGYRSVDSRVGYTDPNRLALNAFKAANGLGVSEIEKFSTGYSAQIGYFLIDNLSFDFRISYIEDKGLDAYRSVFPRTYQFNNRTNWAYSIGLNQFIEVKNSKWLPYFGLMAGYVFQDNTRAVVYTIDASDRITAQLGDAVLQPSQHRFKGSFNVGVDYLFNKRWAMNLATGLSYYERPAASYEVIYGLPTVYEDNTRSFTVPLYVSIRNVIPPKCKSEEPTTPGMSLSVANAHVKAAEHDAKAAEHDAKSATHDTKATEHDAKAAEHDAKAAEHDAKAAEHDAKLAEDHIKAAEIDAKAAELDAKIINDSSIKEADAKPDSNAKETDSKPDAKINNDSSSKETGAKAEPDGLTNVHVVREGETLYKIALRYNKDYKQLAALNNLQFPYILRAGKKLNINASEI